jgi:hypothetical protein
VRTIHLGAILLGLGACTTDPAQHLCATLSSGPDCTAPDVAIIVDGDPSDWSGVPSIPSGGCPGACPDPGDVQRIAAAKDDTHLFLWLETTGAPLVDADHEYLVYFYLIGGRFLSTEYDLHGATASMWLDGNQTIVVPFQVESAVGPTGIELGFPLAAIESPAMGIIPAVYEDTTDGLRPFTMHPEFLVCRSPDPHCVVE